MQISENYHLCFASIFSLWQSPILTMQLPLFNSLYAFHRLSRLPFSATVNGFYVTIIELLLTWQQNEQETRLKRKVSKHAPIPNENFNFPHMKQYRVKSNTCLEIRKFSISLSHIGKRVKGNSQKESPFSISIFLSL